LSLSRHLDSGLAAAAACAAAAALIVAAMATWGLQLLDDGYYYLQVAANISRTEIVGGRRREVRVEMLPERMYAMGVSLLEVYRVLEGADASTTAGQFARRNRSFKVTGNAFFTDAESVAELVVGVHAGRPVYLRDVARIIDGPEEAESYTRIGFSHYFRQTRPDTAGNPEHGYPAVTLALAKKRGTNAVDVARNILDRFETLQETVIPDGVQARITRNYGETAQQKVNDLLSSLGFAILTVVALLALTL